MYRDTCECINFRHFEIAVISCPLSLESDVCTKGMIYDLV